MAKCIEKSSEAYVTHVRSEAHPAAFEPMRPLLRVSNDVVRIAREVRDVNVGVEIVVDELHRPVAHRVVAAAAVEAVDLVVIVNVLKICAKSLYVVESVAD